MAELPETKGQTMSIKLTDLPLRIGYALRLPPAPVLIVLAGYCGEHVQHHAVHRSEHAGSKLIARPRQLPACRQIERDHAHLLSVKFGAELASIRIRQTRQAIHLLDQGFESAMRRNSSGRASLAPLSFSVNHPTIGSPRSAANAATC